jgi:hypothetical protein
LEAELEFVPRYVILEPIERVTVRLAVGVGGGILETLDVGDSVSGGARVLLGQADALADLVGRLLMVPVEHEVAVWDPATVDDTLAESLRLDVKARQRVGDTEEVDVFEATDERVLLIEVAIVFDKLGDKDPVFEDRGL